MNEVDNSEINNNEDSSHQEIAEKAALAYALSMLASHFFKINILNYLHPDTQRVLDESIKIINRISKKECKEIILRLFYDQIREIEQLLPEQSTSESE